MTEYSRPYAFLRCWSRETLTLPAIAIDDVYWAFTDGEPDPLAVREFLAFATQEWETAPRFVTLVGKGNLDYRDLMGLGGNWLPPALAPTDGGLFPSDSMLGEVVGDDGMPEIAIGRLPITTGEELSRIIAAIESFEEGHESMSVLFAADDSERDEFAAAMGLLAGWTTSERAQEIDLNAETLESARERLLSMWQGPLSWVSYLGHAGLDRLATEGRNDRRSHDSGTPGRQRCSGAAASGLHVPGRSGAPPPNRQGTAGPGPRSRDRSNPERPPGRAHRTAAGRRGRAKLRFGLRNCASGCGPGTLRIGASAPGRRLGVPSPPRFAAATQPPSLTPPEGDTKHASTG